MALWKVISRGKAILVSRRVLSMSMNPSLVSRPNTTPATPAVLKKSISNSICWISA